LLIFVFLKEKTKFQTRLASLESDYEEMRVSFFECL
jgi:hypothetical protein